MKLKKKHLSLHRILQNTFRSKMYIEIATEQKEIDIEKACKVYRNELQRLKTLLDESVGVPADLVSVDKSLSRIAKEMLYEDD